jgi:hypothetical protein
MKALIRGRKADSNVSIIKDIVLVLLIIALCIGVYLIFIKPLRGGKEEFIDPYKMCFGKPEGSICNLKDVRGTCQNGMCVATDKPAYSRTEAIGIFTTTFEQKLKECMTNTAACVNATETLKNILQYTKFEEEESQTFIFVRKEPQGQSTFMLSDKGTFLRSININDITNRVMASFEYNQPGQSMCLLKRVSDTKNEEKEFSSSMIIGIAKKPDGYYIFDIEKNILQQSILKYCSFNSLRHKDEKNANTPLCIYYNDDCDSVTI